MEISIYTYSESEQVREYYSCGLEYYLCLYKVNIFMGGLMGQFALYFALNARELYRSTWPTSAYYLQGYSRGSNWDHIKAHTPKYS